LTGDSYRKQSRAVVCLQLALLVIAFTREAVAFQRLRTLGNTEVAEVESYSRLALIPRAVTCTSIEVMRGAIHDVNADGQLSVRLRWGDAQFLRDFQAENARRASQGQPLYDTIAYASALITVQVPSNGSVQRLVRTVSLPIGREETVPFALDNTAINQLISLADQAGFSPPVLVDASWRDVTLSLTVDGRPQIVKPPDIIARNLTVRLPAAFHLPPDLYMDILRPSLAKPERVTFGGPSTQIVAASNVDLSYRVVQPTGSGFDNIVTGSLSKNLTSPELYLRVHSHNLTLDQVESAKLVGDVSYLVFWLRDSNDSVWVSYAPSFDRDRGRTVQLVHREGAPLQDGLLLGFNGSLQLTSVYSISSKSFEVDDSLLNIELAASANSQPNPPSFVRNWLARRAHGRIVAAVTPVRAEKATGLVDSLDSQIQHSVLDINPVTTMATARSVVEAIDVLDADQFAKQEPGFWYGILLHTGATWADVAPLLAAIGPVVVQSGPNGEVIREEVLSAIERFGRANGDPNRDLFQLLLSNGKSNLSQAQRSRYWATLDSIVVPRHASLDEGFRLAEKSKVYLDASGTLRSIRRTLDKLSIDLSGLPAAPTLTVLATDNVVKSLTLDLSRDPEITLDSVPLLGSLERVEISFEGSAVQDRDLTFLDKLQSVVSLTLNLTNTRISGQALANLQNLKNLSKLNLSLARCATLRAESLADVGKLGSLEWLDLNLDGDSQIGDPALAPLGGLKYLTHVSLNLTGTAARAAFPLDQSQKSLTYLSLGLPQGYDPKTLSQLRQLPGLQRLWLRTEAGSDSDSVVSVGLRDFHLQELHLDLAATNFTDSGLNALKGSLPAHVLTGDFQMTAVTGAGAKEFCSSFPGDIVEIALSNNAGCSKRRR
jgi:hypothetical protein